MKMTYFENQVHNVLVKNVDILELRPGKEEGTFEINYKYDFYNFIKNLKDDYIFGTVISSKRTSRDLKNFKSMKEYIQLYRNR